MVSGGECTDFRDGAGEIPDPAAVCTVGDIGRFGDVYVGHWDRLLAESRAIAVAVLAHSIIASDIAVLVVDVEHGALGAGDVGGYARNGGNIVLSAGRGVEPTHGGAVSAGCTTGFEGCTTVVQY